MDYLDFAIQTPLVEASQYFSQSIDKIYVAALSGKIVPFKKIIPSGTAYCGLYSSPWALMGLKPNDELIHGRIRMPSSNETPEHSWVKFKFDNKWYVYTCIDQRIYPEEIYIDKFKAKEITFQQSQQEILDQILTEKYAYQIDEGIWQFKPKLNFSGPLHIFSGYEFTVLDKARVTLSLLYGREITNFLAYESYDMHLSV